MSSYVALFLNGFRRQATHRTAVLGGLGTNVFYGFIRSAIFTAALLHTRRLVGFDRVDLMTYVWIGQAVFSVIWSPWLWELAIAIRSGEFIVELVRPDDVFLRLLATDLGRCCFQMLGRSVVPLVIAVAVFHIHFPHTPSGVLFLVASLLLVALASFSMRFLFNSVAFWVADFRGWFTLLFGPIFLLSGYAIPVQLFPSVVRVIAEFGPTCVFLTVPVQIAMGRDALPMLVLQGAWVIVLLWVGRLVLQMAERRLVVHGG